jgi:hypothetical protein
MNNVSGETRFVMMLPGFYPRCRSVAGIPAFGCRPNRCQMVADVVMDMGALKSAERSISPRRITNIPAMVARLCGRDQFVRTCDSAVLSDLGL